MAKKRAAKDDKARAKKPATKPSANKVATTKSGHGAQGSSQEEQAKHYGWDK